MAPITDKPPRNGREWNHEIRAYQKRFKAWTDEAKRTVERYRSEEESGNKRIFNVLWSNVQVQQPAIFSSTPSVVAERRHKDSDPTALLASEVIMRALNVSMETNGLKKAGNKAVLDLLLAGRGVLWAQYDAEIVPNSPVEPVLGVDPLTGLDGATIGFLGQDGNPVDQNRVAGQEDGSFVLLGTRRNEKVRVDFVAFKDFAHSVEQDWEAVKRHGWVGRRALMTIQEVVDRFGSKFADVQAVLPDGEEEDGLSNDDDATPSMKKAEVWEIWDMRTRKRLFVAKGDERILEETDDPYHLVDFFPCPEPVYATMTNESLVPIPDFRHYAGLADELERINQRIRGLVATLKVAGVYRSTAAGIGNLFEGDADYRLEPVQSGELTEGNGLRDSMDFVPLGPIREALAALYVARDQTKQQLYEVSGISDLLRGSVDHREKAAQSKIKAGYASQRLGQRRRAVETMVRDTARIITEMTVELFLPQALRDLSGFDLMPNVVEMQPPQKDEAWENVMRLLTSDELRRYRIDIETGSTVRQESALVKEEMNEFTNAVATYMNGTAPIVQADPSFGPPAGGILLALVRKYRIGRTSEVDIEQWVDKIKERAAEDEGLRQQRVAAEQAELSARIQAAQYQAQQAAMALQQLTNPQPQPAPGPYPQPVA